MFNLFASRFSGKLLVLQCEVRVPLEYASYKSAYKYVLVDKDNKSTWEYLVEFSRYFYGNANRCLVVGAEYARENRKLKGQLNLPLILL